MARKIKRRRPVRSGESFGAWTTVRRLGRGGNGEVWEVQNKDPLHERAAIKVLSKVKQIAYGRFKDEVAILRTASNVAGILPILDSYFPADIAFESPWYVMPLAISVENWAEKVEPIRRVKAIAEAASTMAELHSRGIGHRDIKPPNLVIHNDRCHVVDFGLVIYPGKSALQEKKRASVRCGPWLLKFVEDMKQLALFQLTFIL